MARAAASVGQFTGDKRCFGGVKAQVPAQVGNIGIYFVGPVLLAAVAFALVENKALDNTGLLRLFSQIQNPLVTGSAVVGGSSDTAIGWRAVCATAFHKILNLRAAVGATHQANGYIARG